MEDLITWLRDQIDDDERAAKSAAGSLRCGCHPGSYAGEWTAIDAIVRTESHHVAGGEGWPAAIEPEVAEHVARWDPVRVLAEVDAERRVLDRLAETLSTASEHFTVESCDEDDAILAETTMRLLALPFSDRPGYRDEWRPSW